MLAEEAITNVLAIGVGAVGQEARAPRYLADNPERLLGDDQGESPDSLKNMLSIYRSENPF
jgi:hypothetical protein